MGGTVFLWLTWGFPWVDWCGAQAGWVFTLGGTICTNATIPPQEKDLRDVGDWRKNIEEKSGMEGRKKMFEAGES